jgi:hypothetical protein
MNGFADLSRESQRRAFEEASARLGLPPVSIEKDYWVFLVLEALFSSPVLEPRLTFKGGTSLSKVWKLIDRFSEDIDIVVDRASLGFSDVRDPEFAKTTSSRKRLVAELKSACARCARDEIVPELAVALNTNVGNDTYALEFDKADEDGQTLLIRYRSVLSGIPDGYIQPSVKLELGARSGNEPTIEAHVTALVAEALPGVSWARVAKVRALDPTRTFLEKAFLVHEENYRPLEILIKGRMSRHLYDLSRLIRAGIGDRALLDHGLFERVLRNRKALFNYSWMDYSTMRCGTLCLVPPEDRIAVWRRDDSDLRHEMMYGDPPTFPMLETDIREFEARANAIPW